MPARRIGKMLPPPPSDAIIVELVNTLVIYKPVYYHFSGQTLQEYWTEMTDNADMNVHGLLDGTASTKDLQAIVEEMKTHAESAALWNYVAIAPSIVVKDEIAHITNMLLVDKDDWDKGDRIDDIVSTYCHYRIGKYDVFSFQNDSTSAYKCM